MKRKWKLFNRKKENNRGVTLIETLVATVVLALAVIPLMNSLVVAAKVNARARMQQESNTVGATIMEQIKAQSLHEIYKKRLEMYHDPSVTSIDIAGHTLTGSDFSSGVSSTITDAWYGDKEYQLTHPTLYYSQIYTHYQFDFNNIDGYYVRVNGNLDTSNKDASTSVGYKSYSDHGLGQYIPYDVTVSLYKTATDRDNGTNVVSTYTGTAKDFTVIKYTDPNTP